MTMEQILGLIGAVGLLYAVGLYLRFKAPGTRIVGNVWWRLMVQWLLGWWMGLTGVLLALVRPVPGWVYVMASVALVVGGLWQLSRFSKDYAMVMLREAVDRLGEDDGPPRR